MTTQRLLSVLAILIGISPVALASHISSLPVGGDSAYESSAIDDDDLVGSALPVPVRPPDDAVVATFSATSYAPGARARLRLVDVPSFPLRIQLFEAGAGRSGPVQGRAVGREIVVRGGSSSVFSVPRVESGLYFARLLGKGDTRGYAPLVIRPSGRADARVAVIMPTYTWQAYNFFDADGDGKPDSWYGNRDLHTVTLSRPFLARGVPPHFHGYDLGFLRWMAKYGKKADFLADEDLERRKGDQLADAYDLVIFPGHEEYVTEHILKAAERFRDRGGNLAFLSANNFFYRVVRRGSAITRDGRWRDLGHPEASLVGAQYVDWYQQRYPNRPYNVTGAKRAPWLFAGTSLKNGSHFGNYGIEIDGPTSDSPRSTIVLATIPDIFGPGKTAAMTYYATPRGAKVFAASVINFGGSAMRPEVGRILDNLWKELSKP